MIKSPFKGLLQLKRLFKYYQTSLCKYNRIMSFGILTQVNNINEDYINLFKHYQHITLIKLLTDELKGYNYQYF